MVNDDRTACTRTFSRKDRTSPRIGGKIASSERDVHGTAYLNARMPMDKPDKILDMVIAKDVADEIIKQDKSFAKYRKPDGGLLVRREKALYGYIESANLWY